MRVFQPGDICYAQFPEPVKSRPVVILSRGSLNSAREKIVVAPITTHIRNTPFEMTVGEEEGLPKESVISLGDVFTTNKAHLSSPKGKLSEEKILLVHEGLKLLFDIS